MDRIEQLKEQIDWLDNEFEKSAELKGEQKERFDYFYKLNKQLITAEIMTETAKQVGENYEKRRIEKLDNLIEFANNPLKITSIHTDSEVQQMKSLFNG